MRGLHSVIGSPNSGKSLLCKTLAEYCHSRGIACTVIDADPDRPDVHAAYGGERISFGDTGEGRFAADRIYEIARSKVALVNCPGGNEGAIERWLIDGCVLEAASEEGIPLKFWFVPDNTESALTRLERWRSLHGERVITVLNEGRFPLSTTTFLNHRVGRGKVLPLLVMPELVLWKPYLELIETTGIELRDAAARSGAIGIPIAARAGVFRFLETMKERIDRLGVFKDDSFQSGEMEEVWKTP
jgi:hypothetical protein